MIFTMSDSGIKAEKKKRILFVVALSIGCYLFWTALNFFSLVVVKGLVDIYVIVSIISLFIIACTVFLSLRFNLKALKSIQYIVEHERLIILKNNREQFNISKDMILAINKDLTNEITIYLANYEKIVVNKYLDNYDQLLEELNALSPITYIDRLIIN